MTAKTPKEIVAELDKYIVGQLDAKKAVALALRNRWRRKQLSADLRNEVLPKNILMIGPTGVGKTEIARRLANMADAPFIKVEATKFTEIGYVGRDVEQIIRDLVEVSLHQTKERFRKEVQEKAAVATEERILEAVCPVGLPENVEDYRARYRHGELDNTEIELKLNEQASNPFSAIDIPGMPGAQMGMLNIGEIFGRGIGQKQKLKKLRVSEAKKLVLDEEAEKLMDMDRVIEEALENVEQDGIVFIDEIDKICGKDQHARGGEVSREGVQRDLLPLIEGTTVTTKHGSVKTDHVLFLTSGAFQVARPSDLLPELQGRLPIRVELNDLTEDDLIRILTEPQACLIKQYVELLKTENVDLDFTDDGIKELARIAFKVNQQIENIGARRLHTIMEKVLEEVSYSCVDHSGDKFVIDLNYVQKSLKDLTKGDDLSKFIL